MSGLVHPLQSRRGRAACINTLRSEDSVSKSDIKAGWCIKRCEVPVQTFDALRVIFRKPIGFAKTTAQGHISRWSLHGKNERVSEQAAATDRNHSGRGSRDASLASFPT